MSGPLFVNVDWSKNGVLTDAGDDVTDRVRGTVTASYGRDQVTALSPVVAGRGGFTLDNRSKDYSPRNVSSPLNGKIKPARPVRITRTVGANTYTIFRGHTDDAPINPDVESKTVAFTMVDSLADFHSVNVTTGLYQGIRTGTAIGIILDAAGWTGGRDIDVGATIIPWYWLEGTDAFDALQQILASEGPPSLLTIDSTGAIVFRDRQHRLVRSASLTPQATFRGIGNLEPVMSKGFSYSDNWENVVNNLSFSVDERQSTGDYVEVFSTDEVVSLGASEVRTVVVQTTDPFQAALVPVNDKDYDLASGSLTSVTLSRTSGAATSITLTAGAGGAVLADGLRLRALSVPVVRTYQIQATDTTSINDYGQRSLPGGSEPVWASRHDAKDIAELIILQRKQPLPILNVRFSCQHTQTTRLNAVLGLDLSERVTIVEPETAVNGPYFIETISHSIDSLASHEVVVGCEAVPASPVSGFILNTSTLNGADPLGY